MDFILYSHEVFVAVFLLTFQVIFSNSFLQIIFPSVFLIVFFIDRVHCWTWLNTINMILKWILFNENSKVFEITLFIVFFCEAKTKSMDKPDLTKYIYKQ